jgi:hypothetical protein
MSKLDTPAVSVENENCLQAEIKYGTAMSESLKNGKKEKL